MSARESRAGFWIWALTSARFWLGYFPGERFSHSLSLDQGRQTWAQSSAGAAGYTKGVVWVRAAFLSQMKQFSEDILRGTHCDSLSLGMKHQNIQICIHSIAMGIIGFSISTFFFLATPMVCGSRQARDKTCTAEVTMLNPYLLSYQGTPMSTYFFTAASYSLASLPFPTSGQVLIFSPRLRWTLSSWPSFSLVPLCYCLLYAAEFLAEESTSGPSSSSKNNTGPKAQRVSFQFKFPWNNPWDKE